MRIQVKQCHSHFQLEFLALKQESRILGHSSNPACCFSMMEQVRLCAVWPIENLLGHFLEPDTGFSVGESYSHALEQGSLEPGRCRSSRNFW